MRARLLLFLLFLLVVLPTSAWAQATYSMPWSTTGTGGSRGAGGVYALDGVAGVTGGLQIGATYVLFSGFPVPPPIVPVDAGFVEPVPVAFRLHTPQPSLFRDQVAIDFELPDPRFVSVRVHAVDGRLVLSLAEASFGAGRHRVMWDGKDVMGRAVRSGMYFVHVIAGSASATQRLVHLQ
jgi:hypothetical protein